MLYACCVLQALPPQERPPDLISAARVSSGLTVCSDAGRTPHVKEPGPAPSCISSMGWEGLRLTINPLKNSDGMLRRPSALLSFQHALGGTRADAKTLKM